jgi:hypothetical protein
MKDVLSSIALGMMFTNICIASTCAPEILPLRARVKNADAIFIGVVKSDDPVSNAGDYDREAIVQVVRVFKGNLQDKVIIQYLVRKPDHCTGQELGSLSVGKGEEKIFYVKKKGDRFFASYELGIGFVAQYDIKQEIEALPDILKEPDRPWWDIFGWTI